MFSTSCHFLKNILILNMVHLAEVGAGKHIPSPILWAWAHRLCTYLPIPWLTEQTPWPGISHYSDLKLEPLACSGWAQQGLRKRAEEPLSPCVILFTFVWWPSTVSVLPIQGQDADGSSLNLECGGEEWKRGETWLPRRSLFLPCKKDC